MPSLLDKRLVFVTGKGGVGKTTVAAALGLIAARRGKRVVLCEVAEQERLPRHARATAVRAELPTIASRRPEHAKEEWLRYQLKSRTLAGVLGGSGIFQYLTAAAPGLTELVTMGKVWDLAQLEPRTGGPRDTTSRSSTRPPPATGSRCCARRAPTRASRASGPIGRQAERIDAFLRDPRPDRRADRRAARGDARQRDGRVRARAATRARRDGRRDRRERACIPPRFTTEDVRRLERSRGRRQGRARCDRGGPVRAPACPRRARAGAAAETRRDARRWSRCRFLFEPELERTSTWSGCRWSWSAGCDRATGSSARRSASAPARAASARRPPRPRSPSAWPRAARRSPC